MPTCCAVPGGDGGATTWGEPMTRAEAEQTADAAIDATYYVVDRDGALGHCRLNSGRGLFGALRGPAIIAELRV